MFGFRTRDPNLRDFIVILGICLMVVVAWRYDVRLGLFLVGYFMWKDFR